MRVVGLPGERVNYASGGNILIDDKAPEKPLGILQIEYKFPYQSPFDIHPVPLAHPLRMPPDGYYLLGDNTEGANDSRYWGALPRKNIVGKVLGK
jgi:signal peptidase I